MWSCVLLAPDHSMERAARGQRRGHVRQSSDASNQARGLSSREPSGIQWDMIVQGGSPATPHAKVQPIHRLYEEESAKWARDYASCAFDMAECDAGSRGRKAGRIARAHQAGLDQDRNVAAGPAGGESAKFALNWPAKKRHAAAQRGTTLHLPNSLRQAGMAEESDINPDVIR